MCIRDRADVVQDDLLVAVAEDDVVKAHIAAQLDELAVRALPRPVAGAPGDLGERITVFLNADDRGLALVLLGPVSYTHLFHDFDFYQTLLKNPMYTNDDVEDVVPGYQSGGYVAIIAHK